MQCSCLQWVLAVVDAVESLEKLAQRLRGRVVFTCSAGTQPLLLERPCGHAGLSFACLLFDMLHLASLQLQLQAHLHDGLFCFQQLQDLRDWTRPCQYTESADAQSHAAEQG